MSLAQIDALQVVQHGTFTGPNGTLYSEQTSFAMPDGTTIKLLGIGGLPAANTGVIQHT